MIHIALYRITILNFILALAFICILAVPAFAQGVSTGSTVDIIPAEKAAKTGYVVPDKPTHPELRLTPDKSELIKLDKKAGSIIIGNPNHINILADSTTQLIVVPRVPGASYFTILDEDGNLLMQRHVIVAAPKEHYLRVRRNCSSKSGACAPKSVYYCPDMCHEITLTQEAGDAPEVPEMDEEETSSSSSSGESAAQGGSALPPEPPAAPAETDVNQGEAAEE